MITAQPLVDLTIPNIICPCCSSRMRLSTIEPEPIEQRERMTFTCNCGFEYRQPHAAVIRGLGDEACHAP